MGHHYVPQYYLRGFGEEGRVWIHDRAQTRSFQSSVKSVANEVGMYSEDVEAHLANNVEAPARAAFEKIRSRQAISEADRFALARYIMVLWKRVPKGRKRALERIPECADEVHEELKAEIEAAVLQDTNLSWRATTLLSQIDLVIEREKVNPSKEIWYRGFEPPEGSDSVSALLSMNWVFLCSDKHQFLTSDNPVFFFEHEGIGRPTSELSFPVSSSVALWATRHQISPGTFLNASRSAVKQINRRTAHNSARFVFSSSDEPWILPFVTKGSWELHRLKP